MTSLFVCGIIAFIVLAKKGAFSLHHRPIPPPFSLATPLVAFALYLSCFLLLPSLALRYIENRHLAVLLPLPLVWILLVFFCRLHPASTQQVIWGRETGLLAHIRKMAVGCGLACAAYPVIVLTVYVLHALTHSLTGKEIVEQIALEQLRSVQNIPWLFATYTAAITINVPVIEELLFRGCAQNYLVSRFGYSWGIATTSALFALFHYSAKQEGANVGLLIGLFLFSCLMGIVYVRKQSLYASIGMHATFNALSITLLNLF